MDKCEYCGLSYPHQGPTGCLTITKPGSGLWTSTDPYVIWPSYIGRDRGLIKDERGRVYAFFSAGRAWAHIIQEYGFHNNMVLDDTRVLRVSEYFKQIRGEQ